MVSEHGSPLATLGSVDAGAQNVHVTALSAALADRGHDVTVFTRRDNPDVPMTVPISERFRVVNVTAGPDEYVPRDDLLPHMPALGHGIAAYWDQHPGTSPDIVHSHFWTSGIAAQAALNESLRGDVPLVHTFHALGTVKRKHQGELDTSPAERAHLEPGVGRNSSCIIATCADEVREIGAMDIDSPIVIVPSGVDIQLFHPDTNPEETGGKRRIVSIGRLVARKGIDLTISALAHLVRQGYDDIELHVLGGAEAGCLDHDPEAVRLRDVAEELGISDRVILRGRVPHDQIPGIIRSASLVACTPWYEPFGIVPLEAMACGVPVVASKVGGLADSVVHNVTGIHVPSHAPEAVANAAALLLDNTDLAAELGDNGVARVREFYSWTQVAKATESVYSTLLAGAEPSVADTVTGATQEGLVAVDQHVGTRDRAAGDEAPRWMTERIDAPRKRQVNTRERGENIRIRRTKP